MTGVLGARRWTPAEDAYLREAMPRSAAEVANAARKLGRSRHAILNRVRKFRGRVAHTWTAAEDRELLALRLTPHTERYAGGSAFDGIAARLGVTVQAVRDRYNDLKREAGHKGGQWTREGLWTEAEDAAIRAQIVNPRIPNGTWDVIADRLGRTVGAVKTRAAKLRRGGVSTPP